MKVSKRKEFEEGRVFTKERQGDGLHERRGDTDGKTKIGLVVKDLQNRRIQSGDVI